MACLNTPWVMITCTNILGLTNAYARGARQHGAKIFEDIAVNDIITDKDSQGNKFIQGVGSKGGSVSFAKQNFKDFR